jgi:ABC-type multidrug transport system fused ATPase/permease subunit
MITLILLAPLAVIFWRMVKHQPKAEAETRAELEQHVREYLESKQAEQLKVSQETQAEQARKFQQMLEEAKQDESSIVVFDNGNEAELVKRVEDLERYVASASTAASSGMGGVMMGTIVTSEERVFLTPGAASWFALYPRRWVGIVGLAAATLLLGLVVWSALVPARPSVSISGSLDGAGIKIQSHTPPAGGRP